MTYKIYDAQFISMNTRLGNITAKEMGDLLEGSFSYTELPDRVYHFAIVVYDTVYQYSFDHGIVATVDSKKYLANKMPIWYDGSFETNIPKVEFEAWIKIKALENFSSKNYHVADNNCSHFTQAISEFLGGNEPEKNSNQRDWLIRNREIAGVLQGILNRAPAKNVATTSNLSFTLSLP